MRVAIVGAGSVGSAAARFLALAGHQVVLIEQFNIDHDLGSSWGASRIIRQTYPDSLYTELMADAYGLWKALEKDSGQRLMITCGGLFFASQGHPDMFRMESALKRYGVIYDDLSPRQSMARYPGIHLQRHERAFFEPGAGLLNASACVLTQARLAVALGADIRENAKVESLRCFDAGVEIKLKGGARLNADKAIVTAGPWAQSLLAEHATLPLGVTRQVYCYFDAGRNKKIFQDSPVWIDFESLYYGFPWHEGVSGVKVAHHGRGVLCDPDQVNREIGPDELNPAREYISRRLPLLKDKIIFKKVCLYANTPDEDFIVDTMGPRGQIVAVSACSGHGFKFSILMGRIAAMMAHEETLPWNLERFRIKRFKHRK